MNNTYDVKHNQCDVCLKQFVTALGFHLHYSRCIRNHYLSGDLND